MPRNIKSPYLLIFSGFIGLLSFCSCYVQEGQVAPPCTLSTTSVAPSFQPQSVGAFDIQIDQSKLMRVMSLPEKDDVCYVRLEGKATVYKTNLGPHSVAMNSTWSHLPPSPKELEGRWNTMEQNLNMELLGLTVVTFYDVPQRKEVIRSSVLLSNRAHDWHLWHEFGHILVAQARSWDARKPIRTPTQQEMDAARDQFHKVFVQGDEGEAANSLIALFNIYRDYDEHSSLEEMVIEATLINTALQLPQLIFTEQIWKDDLRQSQRLIAFMFEKHKELQASILEEVFPYVEQNSTLLEIWHERHAAIEKQNTELEEFLIQLDVDISAIPSP